MAVGLATAAAAALKAPTGVWIAMLVLAGLCLIAAGLQHWREGKAEAPPQPVPLPVVRTGYKGRPGSTGTFRGTTFGSSLDTDIDNEGDVEVEDSDLR